MDNLWNRRTNSGKLSLSTSTSGSGHADSSSNRNASFSKRFGGGDTSSHGKSNPFSATTPGGGLVSPTSASSAFGLGSGAFASFGQGAKTPKTPGNPFEASLKSSTAASSATDKAVGAGTGTPAKASTSGSGSDSKTTKHALRHEWVFWFRPPVTKVNGYIEYEKTLQPLCRAGTVEEFFAVYAHLKRPSALPQVSDYHLFKRGIRPIWEDDVNKRGGKWIVRLKKGVADRYWEDLLLAVIGDQFGELGDDVCGVVLSVRSGEDILSVWTRTGESKMLKLREMMKRLLSFPSETKIEFRSHDEAIQQRQLIEDSRRDKSNTHSHNSRSSKQQQQQQQQQQHHGDESTKQSGASSAAP